jgi:hypothetical protein
MFYIKSFFKLLIEKPLLGLGWSVSLLGLFSFLVFGKPIENKILALGKSQKINPHFFAMIPASENLSYLQRKVRALPGVVKVKKLSQKKIMGQVKKIMGEISLDIDPKTLSMSYSGLEIVLTPGLQVRSQDLIRNYLKKISENQDLSLGPVIANKKTKNPIAEFINEYFMGIVTLSLFTLYLFCNFLLIGPLKEQSFLIETFQRKNFVFSKTFLHAQVPFLMGMLVLTVLQISMASFSLLVMLVFTMSILAYNRSEAKC